MAAKPPMIRKAREVSVFDSHHAPSTQSVIADVAKYQGDPDAREGLCPLCGRYMTVQKSGYCGTEECGEAILDYARREKPEAIVMAGSIRVLLLGKLHRYADPIPPEALYPAKEAGICEMDDCELFAKPRDTLCNECRRNNPRQKNRHQANRIKLGNRIKGLGGIKLK